MKRYNAYKDSGVKWIGEIPSHWGCIKIKHLLKERVEKSADGIGEPLSMSQKFGLIPTSQMDIVPNAATSYIGAKHTHRGDMVLNKLKAHLGVFALSSYDGLVSPDYAVYYGTGRADMSFLNIFLRHHYMCPSLSRRQQALPLASTVCTLMTYSAFLRTIHPFTISKR